jgi:hypothetical protein
VGGASRQQDWAAVIEAWGNKGMHHSTERELIELWLLAGERQASEAQLAKLSKLVESDAAARDCILQLAGHEGWLAWNAADVELPRAIGALAVAPTAYAATSTVPAENVSDRAPWSPRWNWLALAAALAGFLVGQQAIWSTKRDTGKSVHATMTSSTGCVWGPGAAIRSVGLAGISSGDALQLLEGIAEFRLGAAAGDVRLQLEGPASIVLTASGAASTSYGKVIVKTRTLRSTTFVVETAFGRVLIGPNSEVGLINFGSSAEVHCFEGTASVESPWLRSNDEDDLTPTLALNGNEALRFDDIGGPALQSERVAADETRFTPQLSMSNDFLLVSPEYVQAVKADAPVAYWRFEKSGDGVIANEMSAAHQGRIRGAVGWAGPEGNRALELGLNTEHGSILDADSWDDVVDGDFTIELWMKPNHQHLGSMVGFVGDFDREVRRNTHGILLETCGPANPSHVLRVNRLRFLHRAQLTADGAHGVNCFSPEPYELRRWQHVAAVRRGDALELYIDGALVQQAQDDSPTPSGLQLVIGQLYTETVERFFIGHLDEVAIYDRALEADEVAEHHRLLRPEAAKTTPTIPGIAFNDEREGDSRQRVATEI